MTPRVALRSRSHERCEGAVTSDRDVYALIDISNQMLEDSAFDHAGASLRKTGLAVGAERLRMGRLVTVAIRPLCCLSAQGEADVR